MNTYYLVLSQCGAYITHDWFKTIEAADRCADSSEGKERILEHIKVNGTLADVCFMDCEYPEPCEGCNESECICDICEDCGLIELGCMCALVEKDIDFSSQGFIKFKLEGLLDEKL
jgi:hypothetical protein